MLIREVTKENRGFGKNFAFLIILRKQNTLYANSWSYKGEPGFGKFEQPPDP